MTYQPKTNRTKIIRVFPRRTSHTPVDDYAFVGEPPMFRPDANEVHVSCTFTWDIQEVERLKLSWSRYYPIVKVGGPAYDDCGNGFMPGEYLKENITITSRGCNNQCPWCLAWQREGKWRALPIYPGNILQDNNAFQGPISHTNMILDMLTTRKNVQIKGGVEAELMTQYLADRIRGLRLRQIFLACDTEGALRPLKKALKMLQLPPNDRRARCYVLLKYNPDETIMQALIRLLQVWEAGAIPFAQLYQPPDKWIEYPIEWTRFTRTFQRPAATVAFIKTLLNSNIKGKK